MNHSTKCFVRGYWFFSSFSQITLPQLTYKVKQEQELLVYEHFPLSLQSASAPIPSWRYIVPTYPKVPFLWCHGATELSTRTFVKLSSIWRYKLDVYCFSIAAHVATSVSVKLILAQGIGTRVKVLLQGVHLSAQNVPEGLHFCELLTQPVALLSRNTENWSGKK